MRKLLAGVLIVIGLAFVGSVVILTYGPDMPQGSSTALPADISQGGPETETTTTHPSEPVNQLQPVAEFHPDSIRVYLTSGDEVRDFIPSTRMDPGQLDVDPSGNVIHQDATGVKLGPREAPGVVVHWSRSWPGKDSGTTEIDCHAQVNPPMVCTPLMGLPTGTSDYDDDHYKVELTGPDEQVLTYAIKEVVVLDKFDISTRPEFNENTPNRLLIYTCQVYDGQPVTTDRIVVATLLSSKAGF